MEDQLPDEAFQPPEAQYREDWRPDEDPVPVVSDAEAARHARFLQRLDHRASRITEAADLEIQTIEAWRDGAVAPIMREAAYHRAVIERWHRAELAAGRAGKQAKFPGGTHKLTARQPELTVTDADALWESLDAIETAEGYDDLTRVVFPMPTLESRLSLQKLRKVLELEFPDGNEEGATGFARVLDRESGELVEILGLRVRATGDSAKWNGAK